jgi:hypothetical protein
MSGLGATSQIRIRGPQTDYTGLQGKLIKGKLIGKLDNVRAAHSKPVFSLSQHVCFFLDKA